ncbi:hypothetical protein TRV_02396, partial [Trichophyton verrucosum HKI 0517]
SNIQNMSSTAPPPANSATKSRGRGERPEGEECHDSWIVEKRRLISGSDPEEDKAEIKRHIEEVEDLIQEGYAKWGRRQIKREKKKAMKRELKEVKEKIKERKMESNRRLKMQREGEKELKRELKMKLKEERKRKKEKKEELKKQMKMEKKKEKMKREWERETRRESWRMAEASEREGSEQEASIASDRAVFHLPLH